MKTTDKFLLGLVAGVVLLVGAAFAVVLLRPKPAYRADDTPEGVAHNYLLALQQSDYERAYGYLSPTLRGYPDSLDEFVENVEDNEWQFQQDDSITLSVESAKITGERATVTVQKKVFYGGGLFDNYEYTDTFKMTLRLDTVSGNWKISDSDDYWAWCWSNENVCQ
jgi:hypothetical protein